MGMLDFLAWVVVGSVIGWVSSLIMGSDAHQGTLLNIVLGVVGAFVAGLILMPLLGLNSVSDEGLSLASLLIALLGAIVVLAVSNLVRRKGGV